MLEMGIRVGLGTDGCASNNNLDLFSEMDTAAKLQKIQNRDPTSLSAPTVLQMATTMGAEVLGLGDDVGSIETGKKADLVIIDLSQPHLRPLHNVESHLVYAAKSSDVRTVIINGEIVVEDRTLMTLSLEHILSAFEDISREVSQIVKAARGDQSSDE
jgi:5-methylthioadenosine/S-adenosylhomocysteine deaminase